MVSLFNVKSDMKHNKTYLKNEFMKSVIVLALAMPLSVGISAFRTNANAEAAQINMIVDERSFNMGSSLLAASLVTDESVPEIKKTVELNTQQKVISEANKAKAAEVNTQSSTSPTNSINNSNGKYSTSDVYLLEKIVMAEAESEPYLGKIAVANVVLNRVQSGKFPNTIKGVVYQKYQFSPVRDGRLSRVTPNSDVKRAVGEALNGRKVVNKNVYYFMNPNIAQDLSVAKGQTFVTRIGDHCFYK